MTVAAGADTGAGAGFGAGGAAGTGLGGAATTTAGAETGASICPAAGTFVFEREATFSKGVGLIVFGTGLGVFEADLDGAGVGADEGVAGAGDDADLFVFFIRGCGYRVVWHPRRRPL